MTDNNKPKEATLKKLSPEDRKNMAQSLRDNLELISLQADIAEARARIQRSKMEEIYYTLKISEMEKPKDNGEN